MRPTSFCSLTWQDIPSLIYFKPAAAAVILLGAHTVMANLKLPLYYGRQLKDLRNLPKVQVAN